MSSSLQPWVYPANRRMGQELEAFRAKDFSAMDSHLLDLFPNSASQIRLRHVPLASKVSQDGAGQYINTPICELAGVSEVQRQVFEDHRTQLQVNQSMLLAEQQCVLQQAVVFGLWPDARGVLRMPRFMPYHITEVEFDDPWALAAGDLRAAKRVVIEKPLKASGYGATMRIVLERDLAYYTMPGDKQGRGLLTPSGRNPLGRVPLVGTRREIPEDCYLPLPAMDVHSCQVGIVLVISDCESQSRNGTIKPAIATGEGAGSLPASLPLKAGSITPVPGDVAITVIDITPAVDGYLKGAAMVMKLLTQFRNLRPQGYDASIITGPAAAIDREGFLEERRRQEIRCEQLEQDRTDLLVDVHNLVLPRALKLAPAKVSMRYRYVRSRENVLQEAQARSLLIQQGLWSVVEEVAEEEGLSFDGAIDLIEQRAAWTQRFPATPTATTPGLDRSAPKPVGRPSEADQPDAEPGR